MKRINLVFLVALCLIPTLAFGIPPSPPSSGDMTKAVYDANGDNKVDAARIDTLNQSTTGNAATASALAATPSPCGTDQFANAMAANGNLTCASVTQYNATVVGALPDGSSTVAGTSTMSGTIGGVLSRWTIAQLFGIYFGFGTPAQDDVLVRGASTYDRLNITEQTLIGRVTGGHVAALSTAQVRTLLGSILPSLTALTEGGAGALDAIPYASCVDGQVAVVGTTDDKLYIYVFNSISATAESSPSIIAPDDVGANTGRWLLQLFADAGILQFSTMTLPNGTAAAPTTEGAIYHNSTTDATTVGNGATADTLLKTATDVTGQLITGFSSGAGAVAATDTVLQALNKLDGNVNAINKTSEIGIVIDGGGSAITTGIKGSRFIDHAVTITKVTIIDESTSPGSGACVIDIWKDTIANYPPTVADTITASAKPTISSAVYSQDATLTGWTKTISAGDVLRFNVDSCSTMTRASLTLTVTE